jgi:para-aminobenzoate synthetase
VRDVHSRNSYLAAASFSLRYSTKTNILAFFKGGKQLRAEKLEGTYWTWLNHFQENVVQKHITPLTPQALGQEAEIGQPILQTGLIGYFGYELKRESLPGYSFASPKSGTVDSDHADTQLLFVNQVLWLDHYTRQWKLVGLVRSGETEAVGGADPIADFIGSDQPVGLTETEFNDEVERIKEAFAHPPSPPHGIPTPIPLFTAEDDESSYSKAIASAQESIGQGETYELTMTTKFKAFSDEKDPYSMYLSLRERNPAPYSAYMHFPTQDLAILSSSPERFVSIDRDGVAEMKPIKGTIAVSSDEEENKKRIEYLATDKKEIAENLMVNLEQALIYYKLG